MTAEEGGTHFQKTRVGSQIEAADKLRWLKNCLGTRRELGRQRSLRGDEQRVKDAVILDLPLEPVSAYRYPKLERSTEMNHPRNSDIRPREPRFPPVRITALKLLKRHSAGWLLKKNYFFFLKKPSQLNSFADQPQISKSPRNC